MIYLTKRSMIKKYRELLNITQKELSRDRLSVDTIQLLERGKRKLTIPTASIIVDNFNKIAEEKGLVLNLSIKDLMVSEKECIYKNCVEELNKLDKDEFYLNDYLEVLKVAEKYKFMDVIDRVTYTIGHHFYNKKEYNKALEYLKKSLKIKESLKDSKELPVLLNRIGATYLYLHQYDIAYKYIQESYNKLEVQGTSNSDFKNNVLFNLCLSLAYEEKYELSLKYMDKLINLTTPDQSLFIDTIVLKANLLLNLGKFNSTIDLYTNILPKVNDKSTIYYNLSIAYNEFGDFDKSIECATKFIELQSIDTDKYTCKSVIHLGNLYTKEGLYTEAILMYDKGRILGKKIKNCDDIIVCYENIFKCYEKQHKLNHFQKYIENLIEDLDLFLENNSLMNRLLTLLIEYQNKLNNLAIINDILNKMRRYSYEKSH